MLPKRVELDEAVARHVQVGSSTLYETEAYSVRIRGRKRQEHREYKGGDNEDEYNHISINPLGYYW